VTGRAALALLMLFAEVAAAGPKLAANTAQRPSTGDRRRIIGILDVHLDGVPKAIAQQFQKNLEAKLDSSAYWLAPQQRMREMLRNSTKWTEGCTLGACLAEVKVQTGAEIVLLVAISGSDTSFGYVVTLVRTDTGRFVSQESNRCDVCTVNEALQSATLATVKLVTALPERLPDPELEQKAAFETMKLDLERENAHDRKKHRVAGVTLMVAGIIGTGAGFATYLLAGKSPYALGATGAGAGLALGGVFALSF
jgi:hypothetical protein